MAPAGRLCLSSVVDYAKFVRFLYAGNEAVLSDGERQAMQAAQVNMLNLGGVEADIESYGFGLVVDREFQLEPTPTSPSSSGTTARSPASRAGSISSPRPGSVSSGWRNADDVNFVNSVVLALQSFAGLTNPTTMTPAGVAVDPSLFHATPEPTTTPMGRASSP